jgi:hypothetical protein
MSDVLWEQQLKINAEFIERFALIEKQNKMMYNAILALTNSLKYNYNSGIYGIDKDQWDNVIKKFMEE